MSIATTVSRKARSAREFARGILDTAHPLLVQIIPIRRCNIDCGYCNEYDKVSPPVPTEVMKRRIDKLKELGTSVVAFSGGEPMLHPDLDDLIRYIRRHGMMAGLITNGYFLVPKRIEELNEAGLDFLQISIDNIEPDEVSKKSLRVLDKKLQHLKEHAAFDININSVLGGGIKNAEDARTINQRARALGFSTSIGIIHDGSGLLKPLGPKERAVYDDVSAAIRRSSSDMIGSLVGWLWNIATGSSAARSKSAYASRISSGCILNFRTGVSDTFRIQCTRTPRLEPFSATMKPHDSWGRWSLHIRIMFCMVLAVMVSEPGTLTQVPPLERMIRTPYQTATIPPST